MQRHHTAGRTPGARFIDPAALARIDGLDLVARTVVDGFLHGLHRSPHLGRSLDFAEHRAYEPGDDIRRIDWRLYARTDRYHVKQFEAETNADFTVLLDVSGSMGFGAGAVTKLDYARFLAASLAYFALRQRDRVGLATFAAELGARVPPSARRLDTLLHALDHARAEGRGGLREPLRAAAGLLRRRGLVLLLSDLYHEPEAAVDAVAPLRHAGHDVIVFHVLDPAELSFPFDDAATFEDLESGARLPVVPETMRAAYLDAVRAHTAALGRLFAEERIAYALFDTGQPLDHALHRFLAARRRMARARR